MSRCCSPASAASALSPPGNTGSRGRYAGHATRVPQGATGRLDTKTPTRLPCDSYAVYWSFNSNPYGDVQDQTRGRNKHMRESGLEQYFQKSVRDSGGWSIKLMPTQTGVPDRMVLCNGSIYLVELKTDTGSLSKIQVWWHKKAETFGVQVHVLYGKADVDRWIKEELR